MPEGTAKRSDALRRYPALVYLAGAVALALLLPSGLNLPNSGPTTLAEYAPVPGEGEGTSDVAELGAASSGGLGFGSGSGGSGEGSGAATTTPEVEAPPKLSNRRAKGKRCVGKPPRQTEDQLSPPCVAFFEGDNGGATAKGVTRDEVTVVMVNARTNVKPRTFVDYSQPAADDDLNSDTSGRAYARFFNDRYQAYGRNVRVLGYHPAGSNNTADGLSPDTAVDIAGKDPFAVVPLVGSQTLGVDLAKRGIAVAAFGAAKRSQYSAVAPALISVTPEVEEQAAIISGFVCTKLRDRPARFAVDQTMRGRTRKFGIASQDFPEEPDWRLLREELVRSLESRCGLRGLVVVAASGAGADRGATYLPAVTKLQTEGVTTVLVVASSGTAGSYSNNASGANYSPEWVVTGGGLSGSQSSGGADRNAGAQNYSQTAWAGAFGITFDIRRGPLHEQQWLVALREGCPDCTINDGGGDLARHYDQLALLFYGIQAAGPRLTLANFDKGLHAIPQRPSPDPFTPAAYFTPGGYSFIKDAATIWWDGVGRPPADTRLGHYRLIAEGARNRADDWTGDDGALFQAGPSAPCQGSTFRSTGG